VVGADVVDGAAVVEGAAVVVGAAVVIPHTLPILPCALPSRKCRVDS
jgi:hypothetical protein